MLFGRCLLQMIDSCAVDSDDGSGRDQASMLDEVPEVEAAIAESDPSQTPPPIDQQEHILVD